MWGVLSGKRRAGKEPLAGKNTRNRPELSQDQADRYKKICARRVVAKAE